MCGAGYEDQKRQIEDTVLLALLHPEVCPGQMRKQAGGLQALCGGKPLVTMRHMPIDQQSPSSPFHILSLQIHTAPTLDPYLEASWHDVMLTPILHSTAQYQVAAQQQRALCRCTRRLREARAPRRRRARARARCCLRGPPAAARPPVPSEPPHARSACCQAWRSAGATAVLALPGSGVLRNLPLAGASRLPFPGFTRTKSAPAVSASGAACRSPSRAYGALSCLFLSVHPQQKHAPPCGHCTGGREPGGGAACAHFPLEAASSKGRDPQALEPSTWLGAGDRNRTIVSSWCHRVIASQAAVPLVYVPLEAVASKWYGESERNLSEIFRAAEQLGGAIVFLDEIDSLATQRRSPSETPSTGHP